ncbi:hypothetical protein GUJ93_ZPchr0011g27654 [Zizania palustris]|uniref:Uncharacterized protein n=1 Tax=Zizania palustris TaxID=103762 RepID=A0A8J6BQZ7_ZIZPA|nr:hypothetical protein GUJ93_ZPchr0011g27654 [Zizania palustris]
MAPPSGGIVFLFPYMILPGDAFDRLDGKTLCFLEEAACAAVCGAISPVTMTTTLGGDISAATHRNKQLPATSDNRPIQPCAQFQIDPAFLRAKIQNLELLPGFLTWNYFWREFTSSKTNTVSVNL